MVVAAVLSFHQCVYEVSAAIRAMGSKSNHNIVR
ncbi:hypothetical protein OOU_Y34scaffold00151g13 [Pyricularia oryzae Y34]|uniref:Uncharacterized protein n=3 Tax=Pyricularia oryzae TaxID=318829 RepID=A0A4P7MX93_PYROR|nr:hypothetical protein OOU_Y34scaffold00151g13 [Pyricularia oryzae Y34]QBZ53801.1 hypothetical protein PoMZ_09491 [Pyricularia oryzae]